jgi:hypothetical protein
MSTVVQLQEKAASIFKKDLPTSQKDALTIVAKAFFWHSVNI